MKSIKDTISVLEKRITTDLAKQINKLCIFEIGENPSERWFVDFSKSTNRIFQDQSGNNHTASCTIIIKNLNDWFDIVDGKLNPTSAFMKGKVKIQGDMSTALKMQTILHN